MKRIVPNTFTSLNLVSGCIAVRYALMGNAEMALLWIIVGAVLDFFDGFSARLLRVSSPIGVELDSLADCVSFGVAPASLVYALMSCLVPASWPELAALVFPATAYILAAFSAIRLAKFNLDERQHTSFIGLPTPANALFWASFVPLIEPYLVGKEWAWALVFAMVIGSSWLLVAEIPMFALKFKNWKLRGNELRFAMILIALALLIVFGIFKAWSLIIALYVLLSVLSNRFSTKA